MLPKTPERLLLEAKALSARRIGEAEPSYLYLFVNFKRREILLQLRFHMLFLDEEFKRAGLTHSPHYLVWKHFPALSLETLAPAENSPWDDFELQVTTQLGVPVSSTFILREQPWHFHHADLETHLPLPKHLYPKVGGVYFPIYPQRKEASHGLTPAASTNIPQ